MKRFTEDESSLDVNLSLRCNDLVQRGRHRGCAEGSRDLGLQHRKTGLVLEGAQQNWRDGDSDSMESDSPGTLVSPVK